MSRTKQCIIDKILEIDLEIETYSKFGQIGAAKQLKAEKNKLELELYLLEKGEIENETGTKKD